MSKYQRLKNAAFNMDLSLSVWQYWILMTVFAGASMLAIYEPLLIIQMDVLGREAVDSSAISGFVAGAVTAASTLHFVQYVDTGGSPA